MHPYFCEYSHSRNFQQKETLSLGSEGWFRSNGLRVMSPARSHCATSLKES